MINNFPKTISQTQESLLRKEFSAVELVDSYLARIKKYDGKINSFITVCEDEAYKAARQVDKRIATASDILEEYPLLGVTVAVKDLFSTKGVRTTAGSKVLADYVPEYSASAIKKLVASGCILIGKTNQDAWGHGSSGENSDFGATKNPWNQLYVPGGSSSGSAAAVASNMSLVSTGTDTGSSVRMPASFCNLVGLKPTYGSVSRYGVIAFASSLDSIGHITHTVEDSRSIYNCLVGSDGQDATLAQKTIGRGKKQLVIGVPREYFISGVDSQVKVLLEDAQKVFKKNGVKLIDISLPHTKYGVSIYYIIAFAETSSNLSRYDGIRYGNDRGFFGDEAKRRIMLGTYVLSAGYYDAYYLKAMKVRSKIIEDFDNAFEKVDAIFAPICPTPPFKLGEKTSDPLQMYLSDIFTVTANLAGIPGLAIPAGFSKEGLPVGFQLMGPRFSENVLFDLGVLYQKNTNWHTREPKL